MSEPPEAQDWWPTSSAAWRLMQESTPSWRRGLFALTPYGLRIGADGIEVLYSARNRRYEWADIGEVKRTRQGCRIPVGISYVEVTGYRGRVDAIVAEIERLRPPPPLAGFNVPAEQIARWLGIELDGQLTVRLPRFRGWGQVPTIEIFCLLNIVVEAIRGRPSAELIATYGTIMVFIVVLRLILGNERCPRLLISPFGLRHGRREIAWDDVVDVLPEKHGWQIRTKHRSFEMPKGPEAEQVAATIRQVCSARRSGALLPRMGAVPAGALSRAEGVEVSAERGISVAEDAS